MWMGLEVEHQRGGLHVPRLGAVGSDLLDHQAAKASNQHICCFLSVKPGLFTLLIDASAVFSCPLVKLQHTLSFCVNWLGGACYTQWAATERPQLPAPCVHVTWASMCMHQLHATSPAPVRNPRSRLHALGDPCVNAGPVLQGAEAGAGRSAGEDRECRHGGC